MPIFRRRPITVHAVQFDPEGPHPEGFHRWPGDTFDDTKRSLGFVRSVTGNRKCVYSGDWLLLDSDGCAFDVWTNEAFRMAYEPVDTPVDAPPAT